MINRNSNVSGWCKKFSGSNMNLQCTRPRNHKGNHIATAGGIVIEEWGDPRTTSKEQDRKEQEQREAEALGEDANREMGIDEGLEDVGCK